MEKKECENDYDLENLEKMVKKIFMHSDEDKPAFSLGRFIKKHAYIIGLFLYPYSRKSDDQIYKL